MRALVWGIAGLIGLALAADAQAQIGSDLRLDNASLFRGPSLPSFFNTDQVLSSAALGWTSGSPALTARPAGTSVSPSRSSLWDRLADAVPRTSYVSGEVGFLYGRGIGKHSGSFNEEYIVGEVGDDHFHIVVGAAHQESNFDFRPRR